MDTEIINKIIIEFRKDIEKIKNIYKSIEENEHNNYDSESAKIEWHLYNPTNEIKLEENENKNIKNKEVYPYINYYKQDSIKTDQKKEKQKEEKKGNYMNQIKSNYSINNVNRKCYFDGHTHKLFKTEIIDTSQKIFDVQKDDINNPTKKGKYKIISKTLKDKCLNEIKYHGKEIVAKKFGVSIRSINRWVKAGTIRKKGSGRKYKDPNLEENVYKWYLENKGHYKVTSKVLRKIAQTLCSNKDFHASLGWFNKFKTKYNIMPDKY